jgi:hypothetical protein
LPSGLEHRAASGSFILIWLVSRVRRTDSDAKCRIRNVISERCLAFDQTIEVMSFLQELEVEVSRGSVESRQRALWYATDLLIAGQYTDDEIWTFGEVIGQLAQEIEVGARPNSQSDWLESIMHPLMPSTNLPLTIRLTSQVLCFDTPSVSMAEHWLPSRDPKASNIFSQYPNES